FGDGYFLHRAGVRSDHVVLIAVQTPALKMAGLLSFMNLVALIGPLEEVGMYTLYSMQRSGNCYKVRLALAQLNIRYRLIEIDILKGDSRTPEFLAKNPSG